MLDSTMKLDRVAGPAKVQETAMVNGNLAIRAIGGGLPTQNIGHEWRLEAVDSVTGQRVAGAQWGFVPWPFITFAASTTVGGVINLEPRDLTDNPITVACQALQTQVTVSAPGYTPANQIINSRSPTNPNGQALINQPVVFTDAHGQTFLRLGAPNDVGIEMGVTATPSGTAGTFAAIQLINTTRQFFRADGQSETKSTQGQWALDIATGQNTFLYLDRTVPIGNALQISDSPAQQLGGPFVRFQLNEFFRMYFMFLSNTPNASWMPLYLVEWGWSARTRLAGAAWILENGTAIQPVEGPTQLFPVWHTNINEHPWTVGAVTDRAVRSPSRDGARSSV